MCIITVGVPITRVRLRIRFDLAPARITGTLKLAIHQQRLATAAALVSWFDPLVRNRAI